MAEQANKANLRQHRKHQKKYASYRAGGQDRSDARKIRNLQLHNGMTTKEAQAFWMHQKGRQLDA